MTTTPIVARGELVSVAEPLFTDGERAALAGFLTGYSGLTREAYALDLRQYTSWCAQHGLHLFTAKRADVECFGRDMEANGRAGGAAGYVEAAIDVLKVCAHGGLGDGQTSSNLPVV